MGSTYHSLYAHLFFHTKYNKPLIESRWKSRLFAYLTRLLQNEGVTVLAIGGVEDHIHLLIRYRPTHHIPDLLCKLKASSTGWIRRVIGVIKFGWQEGYTIISVSPRLRHVVERYVRNQEEHHRSRSSAEELIEILEAAEIKYNPRHIPKES